MTKLYDRPFVNTASETIPAFGVLEIGGWADDAGGLSVFQAIKPTKDGKLHLINGPTPVPVGRKGWAARAHGVWALYEADQAPTINQEFGPKAGSWALHADGKGGFIIVDDPRGTPASLPGLPVVASTLRIRVVEQAKAEVINRVQGTVASTVGENTPQFLINNIVVLSGVDPRQDPNSQTESIVVQNNLRKAYVNGVDRVIATQSKSDQKWYVETSAGGGANRVHGRLYVDLLATDATATIVVERFTGAPPVDGSNRMLLNNVVDNLWVQPTPPGPTRYIWASNAGAHISGTEFEGEWWIDVVQSPTRKPTRA